MGNHMLKGEVLMGLACVTLRLSFRKGLYVVHIQWDIMSKAQTEWSNIYGSGVLEMGDTIFATEGKSSQIQCVPIKGPGLKFCVII